MRRRGGAAALAGAAAAWPHLAAACAVCFSAREESRIAFGVTTAVLTALPLLMIGGAVLWLRLRARRAE